MDFFGAAVLTGDEASRVGPVADHLEPRISERSLGQPRVFRCAGRAVAVTQYHVDVLDAFDAHSAGPVRRHGMAIDQQRHVEGTVDHRRLRNLCVVLVELSQGYATASLNFVKKYGLH